MNASKSSKSPRAPSIDLEDALRKARQLYDKEGKHPVPSEIAVKHFGYSGINNGSAVRAIASLKFFGLLESNNKGEVATSHELEDFVHTPDEGTKQRLLTQWLRTPKIYSELLDEYTDRLPSDQAVRYRLIKLGFLPKAADDAMKTFKASVEYARYFDKQVETPNQANTGLEPNTEQNGNVELPAGNPDKNTAQHSPVPTAQAQAGFDRIPVRLSGGRRAAIEVPSPLYDADKELLKKQIDLLLTDDNL